MSATPSDPADYAFNHWRQYESQQEHAERVEAAEQTAGRYFASVTTKQLKAFHASMEFAKVFHSPAWECLKASAKSDWDKSTAGARELFNITADEIMRDGEVSEATSLAWDVLAEQAAQQPEPCPFILPALPLHLITETKVS